MGQAAGAAAIDLGGDQIEIDIRVSKDIVLPCLVVAILGNA